MTEAPVFRLFAHCVPVRGARRSAVCDLQRGTYQLIPNALYEILTAYQGSTRAQVMAAFAPADAEVIDEYFAFLEERELGWWCDEPDRFPPLDLSWDAPARITNALIDVGPGSRHDYASLFAQLEELGCRAVQLRFFVPVALAELDRVLALTDGGRLHSVELLLPYTHETSVPGLSRLYVRHPRFTGAFVHSAPRRVAVQRPLSPFTIVFRPEEVTSEDHCGWVHHSYFVTRLETFTEALHHNSCLNRKLSVDQHGRIRNCPALPESFGDAATTPLREALERPGFRALWDVTKDEVETCRDCEFRYVCTDCRALLRDPGDRLSKPARCTYDPYTATWETPAPASAAPARARALPVINLARLAGTRAPAEVAP